MEVRNLLDFLNKVKSLHSLNYATCDTEMFNFLDITMLDEQFTQRIDGGVIYIFEKTIGHYTLIDGLNRFLSLSLLLHAICECHKKTTPQNDKAIKIIRKKYLFNGTKTKLFLPENKQIIYEKIINQERLSGKEKRDPMFVLLHKMWTDIKENEIPASEIFKILQKVNVIVAEADTVEHRDLYYSINKHNRELNQILLIKDYLNSIGVKDCWDKLSAIYLNDEKYIIRFFRDFFLSKFNYKDFNQAGLYEYFTNYFMTMLKYMKPNDIASKMLKSAQLYSDLLNINISNEQIKKAIIKLKMLGCDDTYAYILSVFEDYNEGAISEATFLEILSTIEDYLKKRQLTPNNVSFNELIKYLNAFITYK